MLILEASTVGDQLRKLADCISPVIEGSMRWKYHLIHRPYFKRRHPVPFILSSYFLHHPCNVKRDGVVSSMAVGIVLEGSPVEADLSSTVVEDQSKVEIVLPKEEV